MRNFRTLIASLGCALGTCISLPATAQTQAPEPERGWRALRLELGGSWGHAFPGAPCAGDCGDGLRPGTAWELRAFVRHKHVGFGLVRESATFPWAIRAASYEAPGASISTGATYGAFRAWLFERGPINPYLQLGIGAADYTVNEPGGVCEMNPGTAWQAGAGLDVQVVRFIKYNVAWSTRTAAPEVICDWSVQHPSGVPVPPEEAVTTHTLSMGATFVIGDGW